MYFKVTFKDPVLGASARAYPAEQAQRMVAIAKDAGISVEIEPANREDMVQYFLSIKADMLEG